MDELLDVAEIAKRMGTAPRRIRYVLDHDLVPEADKASQGRGSTRAFSKIEAFAIALAARLLDGGLRQPFVRGFVRGLLDNAASLEELVIKPPAAGATMVFEIADGENVRMRHGRGGTLESPRWVKLASGRQLDASYRPGVVVSVDLADVARRLNR